MYLNVSRFYLLQIKDIIEVLENSESKEFIVRHLNDDIAALSLQYAGKVDFNITVCLQLIKLYKKANKKLPTFTSNFLALTQRSYEQSTSEKVAKYKSTFIQGNKLIDLTAGLGVDSLYISENFNEVVALESNDQLHQIALYNLDKLRNEKIRRQLGVAEEAFLYGFDWIYIDPDRRNDSRHIKLDLLKPNVLEIIKKLKITSVKCYIKLSPLFDIDEAIRVFPSLYKVHLIAEKGEVKELGVELHIKSREYEVEVSLQDVEKPFSFNFIQNANAEISVTDGFSLGAFVLLPNALLVKSKSTRHYLADCDILKHRDFEIYQSDYSIEKKGIRCFEIISVSSLAPKKIKKELSKNGIDQINIIIKGLPIETSVWHKKLATRDGGNYYLFLLKGKEKQAVLAKLIS